MSLGAGEEFQTFHRAAAGYALEAMASLEETLKRPVDAAKLPVRPWH
jgi:hypothetical protein